MDRNDLELASSFIDLHVDAAARELEILPPGNAAALVLAIPLIQAQRLITRIFPVYATRILRELADEEAASILGGGNPNQVAAILRQVPAGQREALLNLIPERLATKSRRLLRHSEDSVGAWMSVDVIMLPEQITVADALHRIRDGDNLGDADAIPVLSDSRQPAGCVGVAELLRAGNETPLSRLHRETDPLVISSRMRLLAAESHPGWQLQDALIVINSGGQVEGILRHRDLRKGLQLAPAGPFPVADDSLLGGLGQAYISTLGSLFSLVDESASAPERTAATARKSYP